MVVGGLRYSGWFSMVLIGVLSSSSGNSRWFKIALIMVFGNHRRWSIVLGGSLESLLQVSSLRAVFPRPLLPPAALEASCFFFCFKLISLID